jgi:hypothetical protein
MIDSECEIQRAETIYCQRTIDGMTLRSISQMHRLSVQRVRQIIENGKRCYLRTGYPYELERNREAFLLLYYPASIVFRFSSKMHPFIGLKFRTTTK